MRWRILVSLLSLAVIFFGVRYAVTRERIRSPQHLHAMYEKTNKDYFDGQLPDVNLKSGNLSDENAMGITSTEWDIEKEQERFYIVIDPHWNTSDDEALSVMQHESCHVATWGEAPDPHGPLFQECMKRFKTEK
jgi:hypothetical protein